MVAVVVVLKTTLSMVVVAVPVVIKQAQFQSDHIQYQHLSK